ncbi:hypothetical protein HQ585_14055, partial [candidate division KSB1 bacterium]|nr:hypothetical protein [candidate division KSB1 bacterium]
MLKLALNKDDKDLIYLIKDLNSSQMRGLLNFKTYEELETKAIYDNRSLNNTCLLLIKENIQKYNINSREQFELFLNNNNFNISSKSATFQNNRKMGIFNWYPYIEGFSYDFVEKIIKDVVIEPKTIYDPFAGTGTTILVSSLKKIDSAFSEINPFMRFIINTKIQALNEYTNLIMPKINDINKFLNRLHSVDITSLKLNNIELNLLQNGFFKSDILVQLSLIKRKINNLKQPEIIKNLLKVALASIVVKESNMIRRADLRYKRENELLEIEDDVIGLFINKANNIFNDLAHNKNGKYGITDCISENAMCISSRYNNKFDLIITSPPYANGTNYFRNTKLELLFLELINHENDLKNLRSEAITAGINNVSKRNKKPEYLYNVAPIVVKLEKDKYDTRIPKLVECYFSDMKIVFKNMHQIMTADGDFFIDIGDSKFKNVHVPSDRLFEEIAHDIGFELIDKLKIRNRFSKDGTLLGQYLLHFKKEKKYSRKRSSNGIKQKLMRKNVVSYKKDSAAQLLLDNWEKFRDDIPYKNTPFNKRNWGSPLHSLCSYQGKLKPAIAHFLIQYFTKEKMHILDPLSGVGTIPFEARLMDRIGYGNDLSFLAYSNTFAKLGIFNVQKCINVINNLQKHINENTPTDTEINTVDIGFNKNLLDYYHPDTFKEIYSARKYFIENGISCSTEAAIFASVLHILHGNRPYALSRRSHPITPFAPQGEYIYKNLITKLNEKLNRVINGFKIINNNQGLAVWGDFKNLNQIIEHQSIDSIITSPPFFDSTRFYMSNWIRMWFTGWNRED